MDSEDERPITRQQALIYEVRGSWWVEHANWRWAQEVAAWWFGRKVAAKHGRYTRSLQAWQDGEAS